MGKLCMCMVMTLPLLKPGRYMYCFHLHFFHKTRKLKKEKKIENRIEYISDQNNRVLQTQQTPNPDAQLPSFFPPFDEHSSLEIQINYISKLFITYTLESNHFFQISEPISGLSVIERAPCLFSRMSFYLAF